MAGESSTSVISKPTASRRTSVTSVNSTRSLQSSDLSTVLENGRTYPNDTYFMPCDTDEQIRLAILHRIYLGTLKGELTTVPLAAETVETQQILDIGTGPGHWAVAIAQAHPQAEVTAIDLAVWDIEAVEEEARQRAIEQGLEDSDFPEVIWEIDDLDIWGPSHTSSLEPETETPDRALINSLQSLTLGDPPIKRASSSSLLSPPQTLPHTSASSRRASTVPGWNFTDLFDFIHIRNMKGAFAHWSALYLECYRSLNPGGWLEVIEFQHHPLAPSTAFARLSASLHSASVTSGYPISTSHLRREHFEAVGFVDYEMREEYVPLGLWPEDEERRRLGKMWMVAVIEGLEAEALRSLTRWGQTKVEDVRRLLEEVRQEIVEGVHGDLETSFRFVRVRKPEGSKEAERAEKEG